MKEFLEKNKYLFWDTKIENLSDEVILEKVIDYGDLEQLRELFAIWGEEKFKKVFLAGFLDKNGNLKDRININDYKMIYILANRLKLNDKIPLGSITQRAKRTSTNIVKS